MKLLDFYSRKGTFIMGKFVVKETKTGYTLSLKATNGQVIGVGGEVFSTEASCLNSIESIKKNAPDAEVTKAE